MNNNNKNQGSQPQLANSIADMIANTTLLRLKRIEEHFNIKGVEILAKVEAKNPAGSVKDRIAKAMLEAAEQEGRIKEGSYLVEATSGNTGIALAALAAAKGYKAVLFMPASMSIERRKLLSMYGAELRLTSAEGGMTEAIEAAEQFVADLGDKAFMPSQFTNKNNPKVHYETTGPEIVEALGACPTIFISGVGTGGTLTGVGKYLKEQDENVQLVAVEPNTSAVLSVDVKGKHALQGIGAGFIPELLDMSLVDRIVRVSDVEALNMGKLLPKLTGLLAGISSAAALVATVEIAKELSVSEEDQKQTVKRLVCLFPDTGERYLSTDLFNE